MTYDPLQTRHPHGSMHWDNVLKFSEGLAEYTPASLSQHKTTRAGVSEREMTELVFAATLKAISTVLVLTRNGRTVQRALEGFQALGFISAYFDMDARFNLVVKSLCSSFTYLCPSNSLLRGFSHELSQQEILQADNISVRPLLVFQAAVGLVLENGDHVGDAWLNFVQLLFVLHGEDLLPASFVDVDDFTDEHGHRLPTILLDTSVREETSVAPVEEPEEASMWAYFFGGESLEVEDEDGLKQVDQNTVLIRSFLDGLNIRSLITSTSLLSAESLNLFVWSLTQAIMEDEHTVKATHSVREEDEKILCIEVLTAVVICNSQRVGLVWPALHRVFKAVLLAASSQAALKSDFLVERTVVNLFSICLRLFDQDNLSQLVGRGAGDVTRPPRQAFQGVGKTNFSRFSYFN